MLTLQIDNHQVEAIFNEAFESNKEKFFDFIKSSYDQRASLHAYQVDKERFMQTYKGMKDGSMKMLTESEATKDMDSFLDTL